MKHSEIKQACAAYLAALPSRNKSPQTVNAYTHTLNGFVGYIEQNSTPDAEISPMDIVGYRAELYKRCGNNTVMQHLTRLHGFFEFCENVLENCSKNPVSKKEIPKKSEIKYDNLTKQEIIQLINCPPDLSRTKYYQYYAICVLIIECGLRNSELRELRLNDIDMDNSVIIVWHGKGGLSRIVPFPETAQKALSEYLKLRPQQYSLGTDYVFGNDKDGKYKQLDRISLSTSIAHYVERITGHKGITSHDLRHSFASLATDAGVPIDTLKECMGHASITTTYIYVEQLEKRRAAQAAAKAMNRM